jgi:cytochrome c biogenesis protein CcmG/thiol:disulfide interchange protein DsbE
MKKNWFVIPILILAMMLTGCDKNKENLKDAPDFTLRNGYGETFTLSDQKGKMVIINFWATWCPPCQREIPDFIDLYQKYKEDGLMIVGVSVDQTGWDVVDKYIQNMGIQYPVMMFTPDVIRNYDNFQSIPTTFIIDKKGRIVNKITGYRPRSFWEEEIKKIL